MTTQQLFAQGNEAFVRYQAELKDGTTFQNTEYIQVRYSFRQHKSRCLMVYNRS